MSQITITSEPYSIPREDLGINDPKMPPVPMSDCIRWTLQADAADAVSTAGSYATVTIVIPFTCTVPSDGTPLTIWGYDFEVDSAEDFTATTFKVETTGLLTLTNLLNMIFGNYFLNKAISGGTFAVVGSTYELVLTWAECREQPRFTDESMVFTALDDLGGSGAYSNGTSPVYVDGFKILTRVGFWQDATTVFLPVSEFTGLEPEKLCDDVGEIAVNYRDDVENGLFTIFPDLTSTSFITSVENGRSLMKLLSLEYGFVFREDCQALSGTFTRSDLVLGINAAFEVDDEYQMRRYWHNHPDGFPPGQFLPDFLTTQPKTHRLCWDSFAWLWWLNNRQEEYGQYRVVAYFNVFTKTSNEQFIYTVNNPLVDGSAFYQPINLNVSPQFVLDNTPTFTQDEIEGYEVSVKIYETLVDTIIDNGSEILVFIMDCDCCEEVTDLYFLTPPGGWGTQVVKIESREVQREGQEVKIAVACDDSRVDKARQGGRTIQTLRSFERISFVIYALNDDENRRWLKHLTASPQHKIKVAGERVFSVFPKAEVSPLAKKFLLDLDSIRISETGREIEYRATGYLQDIPTQKGIEP